MAQYEIVGMYDCVWLAKAEKLADEIQRQFPLVEFHKIHKDRFEWNEFVTKMKNIRGWDVKRSPVIWEVLVNPKGKGVLIGDIDDFCEYSNAYFGIVLECEGLHESLQDLVVANKAQFAKGLHGQDRENKTVCNLALLNAPLKMLESVLCQLLSPISVISPNLLFNIKIFDENTSPKDLDGLGMETVDLASANLLNYSVASTISEVMYDAHYVIIMEDFSRQVEEGLDDWLTRVEWGVLRYVEPMIKTIGDNCRLIIGGDGPQCYVAEIFRKNLDRKKVRSYHVVTAGQHVVTRAKAAIAAKSGVAPGCISRIHAWGWPGLAGAYVEVRDAVLRDADISIQGPSPCEIPLGEIATNPQWLYSSFAEDFLFAQRERIFKTREVPSPNLSLADAVVNLLHIWLMSTSPYGPTPGYKAENDCCRNSPGTQGSDLMDDTPIPVICVGVQCSKNASFPKGTFMVQPAVCYYGKWLPVGKISEKTHERIIKEVNKLWEIRQEMIFRDGNMGELLPEFDRMIGLSGAEELEQEGEYEEEFNGESQV